MTARRDELHELIETLPEDQVDVLLNEARKRAQPKSDAARPWPPTWFASIDRDDLPGDLARNHDKYLAQSGFGAFR
jgi:hypothetical protein